MIPARIVLSSWAKFAAADEVEGSAVAFAVALRSSNSLPNKPAFGEQITHWTSKTIDSAR